MHRLPSSFFSLHSWIASALALAILALPLHAGKRWIPWTTASVGGFTLLDNTITGDTTTWDFGDGSGGHYYAGQYRWNNASARTLGKVTFKLIKTAGDISGLTFTARLWSDSGGALGTELATSNGVTGNNSWSATEVDFEFITPYTTTGSTNYHITIDSGSTGTGTDYASAYFLASTGLPGGLGWWASDKSNTIEFSASHEAQLKIYITP